LLDDGGQLRVLLGQLGLDDGELLLGFAKTRK
jgi:hypothetical protein